MVNFAVIGTESYSSADCTQAPPLPPNPPPPAVPPGFCTFEGVVADFYTYRERSVRLIKLSNMCHCKKKENLSMATKDNNRPLGFTALKVIQVAVK